LKDIRQELHQNAEGDQSIHDDMRSLTDRAKKSSLPLHEKIDEVQNLLGFTEVSKERRILKNREIGLLRDFYN
jgi:hypothetical protein